MEPQTLEREGEKGLDLSSNGKRPVSSWCAMTPAAHTSEAGNTSDRNVSGAMNLGKCSVEAVKQAGEGGPGKHSQPIRMNRAVPCIMQHCALMRYRCKQACATIHCVTDVS